MSVDALALLGIAPFIGSFLGVLVRRLPCHRPIALARSQCEGCGAVLGARDLVPLASFAALRGRCRHCGKPIAAFHVAIELAALAIAVIVVLAGPADRWADRWIEAGLGWTLLALAWIDWDHLLLPDALTLPLLLSGLAVTAWQAPEQLTDHAIAAALGYGGLRLVAVTYRAVRKRDGLGGGDAKLLAAGGAWLGVDGLAPMILLGALACLGIACAQWAAGRRVSGSTALPFGVGLAASLWLLRLLD